MNEGHKVIFYPHGISIKVSDGIRLIDAAIKAGIHINSSCGGVGACGRCRVIVEGKTESESSSRLSSKEIQSGIRLACLTKVKGDLCVRVPLSSRLLKQEDTLVNLEQMVNGWEISPLIKRTYLELPLPTKDDNIDDLSRLSRGFKEGTGLDLLVKELRVLKILNKCIRRDGFKVTLKTLHIDEKPLLIDLLPGKVSSKMYVICIDIGTTTVATSLIDLENGKILDYSLEYNGQISCGEDVISRIVFSSKKGGLRRLQGLVIKTINDLIQILISRNRIESKDVLYLVVAGNTTMIHLFLGIDPRFIRKAPYLPVVTILPPLLASEVGLKGLSKSTYIFVLPSVASFLGADIVSGILGTGIFKDEGITLYIDIGTNSEVVLGNREYLVCCSTSAGPALEGGGVRCGMRAAKGAIDGVKIDRKTYEPIISTIGNAVPIGICGSGLIEALAEMFEAGIIDQRGRFNDLGCGWIRECEYGREYILAKGVSINEVDLNNLIRAKAAIYSGICILLESVNLKFSEINRVIISGNLGRHIDIEKAEIIGLLPPFPKDKVLFVGNAVLLGARLSALSRQMFKEGIRIARSMTYIELADNPKFINEYVASLFLPHTDIERFKR